MARPARPFALYRRPTKKAKEYIYHAKIRNPVTGRYDRTISTGQTSRAYAEDWIRARLADEAIEAEQRARQSEHVTLHDLATDFWNPEGEYAESRRARGYSISNGHLEISESYTRNHIIPAWGSFRVGEITAAQIDRWVLELHRKGELSSSTINKLLQSLRSILDVAVRRGYIAANPASSVKPLRNVHRKRGVLTDDEVRRLLTWPGPFTDYRQYTINLLAFATGARIGEIRGLTIDHVHPDRVEIVQAWEEGHGLKPPKYGSIRAVPISTKVYEALTTVIEEHKPETLLFYGALGKDRPVSKSHIEQSLYRALAAMVLEEEDLKSKQKREQALQPFIDRGVTFHSWRHKLNTILRSAGVPDAKIRLLTGHRGEHMTDWYTKFSADDYTDVLHVQTALLAAAS